MLKKQGSAKPSVSKSQRSGLTLPISRIDRIMKGYLHKKGTPAKKGPTRVGATAAVCMTAVAEYLSAEILEIAGKHTKAAKRKRMTPDDIALSIHSDEDLARVFKGYSVYTGEKMKSVGMMMREKEQASAAAKENSRRKKSES